MKLSESVLPRAQMGSSGRAPLDRAVLLAWLAKQQIETPGLVPPAIVSDTLAANAAESLTGDALLDAWREYVAAVRDEKDAELGRVARADLWAGLPADLPPGVTALEMARRNTQAALSVLVHGSDAGMSAPQPRGRLRTLDQIREAGARDQAVTVMPRETGERVAALLAAALQQIESDGVTATERDLAGDGF